VLNDVLPAYHTGSKAKATFVGANPRNDLRIGSTYASVEMLDSKGAWVQVRDDYDWSLVFEWRRTNSVLGTSEVDVTWEIENDAQGGLYRIRHFGASKTPVSGDIVEFEGMSGEFRVG